MAFFSDPFMRVIRALGLEAALIRNTWLAEFFQRIAPVMAGSSVRQDEVLSLGFVGTTAAAWMSVMEAALVMQKQGLLDVTLRYEDLVQQQEGAITAVVENLFPALVTNEVCADTQHNQTERLTICTSV